MLPHLSSPSFSAQPRLRHAFFTRKGGASEGIYASLNCGLGSSDDRAHVIENRARAATHLGVPPWALLTVYQNHSPTCVSVTAPWAEGQAPEADALVTATPGIALGILAADCAPVLFTDPQAHIIGAAHAGWKGAFTGVLDATLAAMEALGADRARIIAAIGPCIAQQSYEVGPEFEARFHDTAADTGSFFRPSAKPNHFLFDLPAYVTSRLNDAGVAAVESSPADTYAAPEDFFSFRRATHRGEPDYGRALSAIVLV